MGSIRGTTKSGGRKHDLDKFYTKEEIATSCIELVENLGDYNLIIEPSAGNGSFSSQIDNIVSYDIEPENDNIIKKDWFTYQRNRNNDEKVLVIGNPPFGQQNNLAIKFINHSATFANTIAFIVPLSFMKQSIINKIDKNFHLKNYWILPKNSFTLNGVDKNIPCVFQIWEYSNKVRDIKKKLEGINFKFCKKEDNPDVYIQRVGGRAGYYGINIQDRNINSNYFIKLDNKSDLNDFLKDLSKLKHDVKNYSVGPRSISKPELLLELFNINSKFVKEI